MLKVKLKLESNCSTGPALNLESDTSFGQRPEKRPCVDYLVKLYLRIVFNNKEIIAVSVQNHIVVISVSSCVLDVRRVI